MSEVKKPHRRGIATVEDLKVRSVVDAVTHCWLWQGAMTRGKGHAAPCPALHVFDPRINDKRVLSGPLAAWIVAFGRAPRPGEAVYRACGNTRCLNPSHLRCGTRVEFGEHMRRSNRLKGVHVESRRRNVKLAQMANLRTLGIAPTPPDVVIAVRSAPPTVSGVELAKLHGVSESVVSRIRLGKTHKDVQGSAA